MRKTFDRRVRDGEAGFTLIELLIVITILGILAAVVVFSVGGIGERGSSSACKADYATLQTAQEAYYARVGRYGTMGQLAGIDNADTTPPVKVKVLSSESKLYNTDAATGDISAKTTGLPSGYSAPCPDSP